MRLEPWCWKKEMERPLVRISTNWSVEEYAIEAIESGNMDLASILEQIELQIANVKEESFSRKEIEKKRIKDWEGRILQEVEDLKKNFSVWQYIKQMIGRLIIMRELV